MLGEYYVNNGFWLIRMISFCAFVIFIGWEHI